MSVLIFLFPPLYGEGYETIKLLIDGSSETSEMILEKSLFFDQAHLVLLFMFLVIVFKAFASTVTNCAGGCGGIFAPSLFSSSV